ncbi:DNA polymerase III subunit delta [Mycoplasmopsis columbinasalis]|uniref:DNA polymerase III subunit delta n=1 Tax=Mycoplasmopsis columbinasalis TaxID=114880 RepID=A0A449BA01_9BACT|nr:hypothetical protein [Mycoplasmopsis columbinasalis]VEU78004.1 DNA-directed DNA polymerase [Mycoplasmopsis columbinasalis]
MYLICGQDTFLIQEKVQELKNHYPDYAVQTFNCETPEAVLSLITEANNQSLFKQHSFFIVNNLLFFTSKLDKNLEKLADEFLNVLHQSKNDVFVFVNNEITECANIYKNNFTKNSMIKDFSQHIDIKKLTESQQIKYIIDKVTNLGGNINYSAAQILSLKTTGDLGLINNEINKLLLLKKTIDYNDVETYVDAVTSEDAFAFVNSFESNNFDLIWVEYQKKKEFVTSVTALIAQISQQLIICNQIAGYKKLGKSLDYVANDLKLNVYRVKRVNALLQKLGLRKVRHLLKSLALLDRAIINGKVNEWMAFEHFLIVNFL